MNQDLYGDPKARGQMATGPHAEPKLVPTAAEIDPGPPDPGPCPTCGQERVGLANSFATGARAHPSLRVPVRAASPDTDPDHIRTNERLPR